MRETAAQGLGLAAQMLNKQDSQLIIDHLAYLVQYGTMTTKSTADDADIWPIRHGGLLGLKWIFAVNQPLLEFNFTSLYSMLCSSLRDRSDDCRLVAVSVILPICEFICHDHLFRGIEIAQLAWALIKNGDDLTASTGSIINLLSSLMQYGKAGLNANLFILIVFKNAGLTSISRLTYPRQKKRRTYLRSRRVRRIDCFTISVATYVTFTERRP